MAEPISDPRSAGGTLLRAALDEARRQVDEETRPGPGATLYAFAAYDKDSGAQMGAAVLWRGPKGSEWMVSGALARKVQTSPSPFAVRLELRGRL